MSLTQYQTEIVTRTMRGGSEKALKNYHLGLIGEMGELVDLIKKYLHHGHGFDRAKLLSELGDNLWYTAALANCHEVQLHAVEKRGMLADTDLHSACLRLASSAVEVTRLSKDDPPLVVLPLLGKHLENITRVADAFGIWPDEIMDANEAKLRARYPEGFCAKRSQERKELPA